MQRPWMVGLGPLALLVCLPPALPAQEWSFQLEGPSRARLGVVVRMRAHRENDKFGATLAEVLPGSPAEKAGLKDGDIVTRFNDTRLGGIQAEEEDQSGPGLKLVELARKLEPGDTVRLEYRRDGSTRQATVVAEAWPELAAREFRFRGPDLMLPPRLRAFEVPGLDPDRDLRLFMEVGGPGLELANLNEGLGEYFGTRTGVLVLEPPRDTTLPLKAGDVILSIDGREPRSARHAERILASYDEGETVKLEIMRQKRRETVTWTVPERGWKVKAQPRGMRMRVHPATERSVRT